MAPLRFDRARILNILALAGERLDGEWLLIGGGAAAAWFQPDRTTEDIDLIGLAGTQAERFALMTLATELAIPVEAVNSAADFFVRRIPDWRAQLVPVITGRRATIYRPNATLFVLLKLERLSAVDLADCLALIEHDTATADVIDGARVSDRIAALPPTDDAALEDRRRVLARALGY
jgi:hypothetical protein